MRKQAPDPAPARHPALDRARGRIIRALVLLTVAILAWAGWMLWRGDNGPERPDGGEKTDRRLQEPER